MMAGYADPATAATPADSKTAPSVAACATHRSEPRTVQRCAATALGPNTCACPAADSTMPRRRPTADHYANAVTPHPTAPAGNAVSGGRSQPDPNTASTTCVRAVSLRPCTPADCVPYNARCTPTGPSAQSACPATNGNSATPPPASDAATPKSSSHNSTPSESAGRVPGHETICADTAEPLGHNTSPRPACPVRSRDWSPIYSPPIIQASRGYLTY